MKTISRLAVLASLLAALLGALPRDARAANYRPAAATAAAGSVPNAINYQGRLIDNGFPVNATRNITFRLYDNLVAGTLLYTVPSQQIVVSQGVFGTTLVISTAALAGPTQKFLEVQIDATILTPREPLNAVPYALIAKSLEDNVSVSSVSVGASLISSGTLALASIQALSGATGVSVLSPVFFTAGNDLGLGTLNPTTLLHMSSGTLTIDGNSATAISAVGNVGLGLTGTIPNAQLQVANPGASPAAPDVIVGNGSSVGGNNTQAALYRGGAVGSYVGLDAYDSGAGGAPLVLNGNNNGSVGIGSGAIAPGAKLDVDGSAQFGSAGNKSAFSAAGALTMANNAALNMTGPNGNVISQASVTASGLFANTILTTGRVGIGGAPTNPLSVTGNANVTGTLTAGTFSGGVSGNSTSATNLANGLANQVPYQTGASATTFVGAPGANMVFWANSGAPSWTNTPTFNGSNVTSLTAGNISAGTAGINISGNAATVTTNANLTGNVTSVGNATTIAALPAISGASLTSLTPGNISAGTAGINISGNAATVTTDANLTGNVTSVGNATTIAALPAISGASLTSLTPGNISGGTAGISITGNAATAHAANGGESLTTGTKAVLSAIVPAIGQLFFCTNCAPPKVVVATGTAAGNFADPMGGNFQ